MKKAWTVLMLAGLAASLIALLSVMGQTDGLREREQQARQKKEALQAQYDEAREAMEALTAAKDQLIRQNAALREETEAQQARIKELSRCLEAAQAEASALASARQSAADTFEQERQKWAMQVRTLTEEKDAAACRLTEALAVLMPSAPEDAALPGAESENLFADPGTEEAMTAAPAESPEPRDVPAAVIPPRRKQNSASGIAQWTE